MEKYVTSGAAAMTASAVVHPVELIKTRMQVASAAEAAAAAHGPARPKAEGPSKLASPTATTAVGQYPAVGLGRESRCTPAGCTTGVVPNPRVAVVTAFEGAASRTGRTAVAAPVGEGCAAEVLLHAPQSGVGTWRTCFWRTPLDFSVISGSLSGSSFWRRTDDFAVDRRPVCPTAELARGPRSDSTQVGSVRTVADRGADYRGRAAVGRPAACIVRGADALLGQKNALEILGTSSSRPVSGRQTAVSVLRAEGFAGFYAGLSASLVRQATYGTARLGLHREFSNRLKELYASPRSRAAVVSSGRGLGAAVVASDDVRCRLPAHATVASAMAAACCGVCVGNPFDVALVRLQVDGMVRERARGMPGGSVRTRRYAGLLDVLRRIWQEEGGRALWSGTEFVFVGELFSH